jgi:hypothetical protein
MMLVSFVRAATLSLDTIPRRAAFTGLRHWVRDGSRPFMVDRLTKGRYRTLHGNDGPVPTSFAATCLLVCRMKFKFVPGDVICISIR